LSRLERRTKGNHRADSGEGWLGRSFGVESHPFFADHDLQMISSMDKKIHCVGVDSYVEIERLG
jgi:hypothetical protein